MTAPPLEAQEDRLYSMMDSIHDNVVISDRTGTILWVSPSCEATYGIPREDFIGYTSKEMEERKIWDPAVAPMVLEAKKKVTLLEETQQGEKLVVTGIPVLDENNEVKRVVSYSFDPSYILELSEQYKNMENLVSRYSAELSEYREKEMLLPGVVSQSPEMKAVQNLLLRVAKVETTLMITGESGVGKSLIARKIHQHSPRNKGPFIEINCGSIPENLLESELFGYEPGAFTGAQKQGKVGMIELAQEGTLLLDEIGELPPALQVKLLKVIQDKVVTKVGGTKPIPVDFRLIAATNKNLKEMVAQGEFREDLFYRLNVVPIPIPPLRERREDILPLIHAFLKGANEKYGWEKTMSGSLIHTLIQRDWPGNIRQLKNMVERLAVLSDGDRISDETLVGTEHALPDFHGDETHSLKETLKLVEKKIIQKAYARHGTTVGVAKALSISQSSAARKVAEYVK